MKNTIINLLELERGDKASYRIVGCRPSDDIVLIQFFNSSIWRLRKFSNSKYCL